MSAITDIYDYFTPLEDAVCAVFKSEGITCFSGLGQQPELDAEETAADGTQSFQKELPRVEVVLHPGAGLGQLRAHTARPCAAGHREEQARRSTLSVLVLTKADPIEHRAFVAQVQYVVDTLAHRANNTRRLTKHRLSAVRQVGGTAGYTTERGVIETMLNCEVDFSVQTTAWADLG